MASPTSISNRVPKMKVKTQPLKKGLVALGVLTCLLACISMRGYFSPIHFDPMPSPLFEIPTSTSTSTTITTTLPAQFQQKTATHLTEEETQACENINEQGNKCEFVTANCGDIAGLGDYLKFRYCTMESLSPFLASAITTTLAFVIILMAISLLATTADVFFVPALSVLSEQLNLSPTVAGITFLALGNGAPDLFTAMAGAAADDFPLVLGALVGAGVCISCVVLGSVISVGNTVAEKKSFWRDISMYAICMITVVTICASGSVRLFEAFIFIIMYLVYVTAVIFYVQCKRCARARRNAMEKLTSRSNRRSDSVQPLLLADEDQLDFASENETSNMKNKNQDSSTTSEDKEQDEEERDPNFFEGVTYPHPDWETSSGFNVLLGKVQYCIELPFSVLRWLTIPSTGLRPDKFSTRKMVLSCLSPFFASLMLFISFYGFEFDATLNEDGGMYTILLFLIVGCVITPLLVLFQLTVFTHAAKRLAIAEEMHASAEQVQSIGGISTSDNSLSSPQYSQYNNQNINGDANYVNSSSLLQISPGSLDFLQEEIPIPFAIQLMSTILALIAFISCVGWLNLIANELVAVLQTIGIMFDISTTILGLTVLAIGNSIPDWIANTAVARAGSPETALASIFGAPLLTTLGGLGISLSIACYKISPAPFVFTVTKQVIITWVGVLFATVMHMVVFPLTNYSPPVKYSMVLYAFYGIFLVAIILSELKVF